MSPSDESAPQEPSPEEPSPEEQSPEEQGRRRRRLAEIFGDVLPGQTSDDLDPAGDESEADRAEWLRRQVPPHHG